MKFTIDRTAFLKALSHGQSVVERRTTVPILSNILLTATSTGLKMMTTDTDIALVESVPAMVMEPGATTVSAQMLFEIVRKLPENSTLEVTLLPETGQLNLKAGRSRFNLACLPAAEFPQITQGELPCRFTMPVATFKKLLDRTRFAMSTEETRYYLNGIHFHVVERENQRFLRSVATDAHRLAFIEAPLPNGAENMPGIIMGRKTVVEVRKLIEDTTSEVGIAVSSTRIEFTFENAVLSSRLIDATYPEYEKAIPLSNNKTAIVDAKLFASAVDRVATVSGDKIRAIKMNLHNNTLILSAASHDFGDAVEEISIDFPYDTPIEIGFNARYLLDIAQQINEDEAQVVLANGDAPALIKGMIDREAIYVLMPMRV